MEEQDDEEKEKPEYFYRLICLVVDLGTEVLLKLFSKDIPQSQTVKEYLNIKTNVLLLNGLKKRKVFNDLQLEIINAAIPDVSLFDISLLYILISNLTNIQSPTMGWNTKYPIPSDKSAGALLMNLKRVRNEAIAHRSKGKMKKSDFEKYWIEAKDILIELAGEVGQVEKESVKVEIDKTKVKQLVGDIDNKLEALLRWAKQDQNCEVLSSLEEVNKKSDQQINLLEDIKSNVQTNTDQLKTLRDQFRQITGTSSGIETGANQVKKSQEDNENFAPDLADSKNVIAKTNAVSQNSSEEESSEEEDDEFNRQQDSSELILKDYQLELAENAVAGKNTVICAGTGTGKTRVALHVVKEHLNRASQGKRKVVFMARTSTLIKQQADRFKQYLPQFQTKLITGENVESSSIGIFVQNYDILCLTPQILANNLDSGSVKSMEELSLIILDECHHTKKDEPYNNLMRKYLLEKLVKRKRDLPQVIGLTASIGVGQSNSDEEALDYMLHLFARLDVRDLSTVQRCTDTYEHEISHASEELIEMTNPIDDPCRYILLEAIDETENRLKNITLLIPDMIGMMSVKCPDNKQSQEYNKWTLQVEKMAMHNFSDDETARNIRTCAIYLNVYHAALEVNNLLGPVDVMTFLANKHKKESLRDNQKKLTDEERVLLVNLQSVQSKLVVHCKTENPNVRNLCDTLKRMMLKNIQDSRAMVFVKARATCVALTAFLKTDFKVLGIDLQYLYGKQNRGGEDGMTESEQNETIEKFRKGFYKILVATSIGIEGIDVPDCNIVLNYNFFGNVITKIQMKGRSRKKDGHSVIMGNEQLVEHERINAYKLAMMQRALKLFYKMDPKLIETKIISYQEDEMNTFTMRKEVEKISRERKSTDLDFEIRCKRCNVLACYISDVRMVKCQYIVIDESFKDRIEIKPHSRPRMYEGFDKKFKMDCKKCPSDWGIVTIYNRLMCRTLKIVSFNLRNTYTGVVTSYKKWADVPTRIPEIKVEDLARVLSQVQQDETIYQR